LLVITPQPKYLEQVRVWVERLDRSGAAEGGEQLYVYQVQNGNADKMAALLGQHSASNFPSRNEDSCTGSALAPGLNPAEIKSPGHEAGGVQERRQLQGERTIRRIWRCSRIGWCYGENYCGQGK